MNVLKIFCCVVLLVLGVHSEANGKSTENKQHLDNVVSASITSAKTIAVAPQNFKRGAEEQEENISTAATQHQYDQNSNSQQVISPNEFLAYLRIRGDAQNVEENATPQQYDKPQPPNQINQIAHSFYTKNPGHPLAGSSLEKEIEKLVSANSQHYSLQGNGQPPPAQQHHEPVQSQTFQTAPGPSNSRQPQYRSPVVFKNQNDIVYIPYQQQLLRDQYARPQSGITKAKVEYISAYPSIRAPYPSDAIEYGRRPQVQYAADKPQESFKELYIQQQQQNHLKRLQSQQQANDNLNLQSHAQTQSVAFLPSSPSSKQAEIKPEQTVQEQTINSNLAQLAERLFKTPLEQQKPLSQEEFRALVAAGYPVQAVPVPVVISSSKGHANQPPPAPQPSYPQYPQRYSPASVSIPYPQPFSHPKQAPVQYQQPNRHAATLAANPRPIQQQPHRFYAQENYANSAQNQQSLQQYSNGPHAPQNQAYTYVLQQGENEESAAEKLRQQIIQEINAQTHKGVANSGSGQVPPQLQESYAPTRVEYQHSPQPQSTNVGQGQAAPTKQLTEDQRQYYKRLEYY